MSYYNGYAPGESRTWLQRRRAADGGHSTAKLTQRRVGNAFKFRYELQCECGKVMTGWDSGALSNRHSRHQREETQ